MRGKLLLQKDTSHTLMPFSMTVHLEHQRLCDDTVGLHSNSVRCFMIDSAFFIAASGFSPCDSPLKPFSPIEPHRIHIKPFRLYVQLINIFRTLIAK